MGSASSSPVSSPNASVVSLADTQIVDSLPPIARGPDFYCAVGTGGATAPSHVIANQAQQAQRDFPSLWYVNFPQTMSGHDAQAVERNRKNMTDFRSWSSKKWWEEVDRRFGVANDAIQRASQSRQFAEIACEDMVKMSWLRTTVPQNTKRFNIECDAPQLRGILLDKLMTGWGTVDAGLAEALAPVFQSVVDAPVGTNDNFTQMKNIVMEKYVYDVSTGGVTSYIRLVSFELHETFRNVMRGSTHEHSHVNADFSFYVYEAVFEAALWEQFAATLQEDETNLLWDYVRGQTINVPAR